MRADQLVTKLLDLPTLGQLRESPQYYPGPFAYQRDSGFRPLSMDNYWACQLMTQDADYAYALSPAGNFGYVFSVPDTENPPRTGIVPVMTVQLRPSNIKGYMQAHRLSIRESFARGGVATRWYFSYVQYAGGVVSDFEHLEGGKRLWKSFVRTATDHGLKISLVDSRTGEWLPVSPQSPDEAIWSLDKTLYPVVLVLER